jgi:hypothetical protein
MFHRKSFGDFCWKLLVIVCSRKTDWNGRGGREGVIARNHHRKQSCTFIVSADSYSSFDSMIFSVFSELWCLRGLSRNCKSWVCRAVRFPSKPFIRLCPESLQFRSRPSNMSPCGSFVGVFSLLLPLPSDLSSCSFFYSCAVIGALPFVSLWRG